MKNSKIAKIKNSRSAGFTIAEMLIVTIIIGILSTIGTRTYYTEKNRFEFNNGLAKTASIIKTARNMATSSQAVYSNIAGKQIVPRNGYGVYINLEPAENEPHFTLFASLGDENNDVKRFDKGVLSGGDLEIDYVMETYRLPKQAEFHYFIYDNNVEWDNDLDPPAATATEAVIFFRPPLADTYIGSNATMAEDLEKLGMRFFNIYSNEGSSRACQTISLARIQTFPIIEGSDCSEFTIEE